MSTEPLPCPFCGGPPADDGRLYVHCANAECYAFGPTAATREAAVILWNRPTRVPSDGGVR